MTNSGRGGRPARRDIYAQFKAALAELDSYGGLPQPDDAKALWDGLWVLEAHHSTALEGNTLVLAEVERLLEEGRAVGAKELKDYMEVQGYANAAHWVYEQAINGHDWVNDSLITFTEIRQIHAAAMAPVWEIAPHPNASPRETPGNFREHDILAFPGGMTPPSFPLIPVRLDALVHDIVDFGRDVRNGTLDALDIPERLAALHCEFERIHPFLDGNGRTGRLVLNLILVRLGWPPVVVFKRDRAKYLRALDRGDAGDFGALAELLARSVIDNLHRLVPSIAGPARLVPLAALANKEFSVAALRQAATRGRLEATLDGVGQWRSSQEALARYRQSRYKRAVD